VIPLLLPSPSVFPSIAHALTLHSLSRHLLALFSSAVLVADVYCCLQGGAVKTWKRRYFILRDNFVFYYKKATKEPTPSGIIRLDNCTVEEVEVRGFAVMVVMVVVVMVVVVVVVVVFIMAMLLLSWFVRDCDRVSPLSLFCFCIVMVVLSWLFCRGCCRQYIYMYLLPAYAG